MTPEEKQILKELIDIVQLVIDAPGARELPRMIRGLQERVKKMIEEDK